jgi:ABC-type uncharacterized transport system substrate-binding protein
MRSGRTTSRLSSGASRISAGAKVAIFRFDFRFTGESTERMRAAATEVVAMAPDVIFVSTNPAVSALLQVTRTIPIVFTWVSDSIGSGYVASLAHPGGNITGFHSFEPALGAKRIGILKEIAPTARRVAFVRQAARPSSSFSVPSSAFP